MRECKVCNKVYKGRKKTKCLQFVNCFCLLSTRQIPIEVLLLLCIPVVDPDKEDKNWRRPLNCLQLITAPLVCVLTFQSGQCKFATVEKKTVKTRVATQKNLLSRFLLHLDANHMIQGQFPLWLLFLLMGLFLSAIVFFTTRNDSPPRYHPVGLKKKKE